MNVPLFDVWGWTEHTILLYERFSDIINTKKKPCIHTQDVQQSSAIWFYENFVFEIAMILFCDAKILLYIEFLQNIFNFNITAVRHLNFIADKCFWNIFLYKRMNYKSRMNLNVKYWRKKKKRRLYREMWEKCVVFNWDHWMFSFYTTSFPFIVDLR